MNEFVNEVSATLLSKRLGAIDLSYIENEKELTEQEYKDYCAAIFAVFPRIEKDIKKVLYEQLMFTANKAQDWDQVLFGRGTSYGATLLLELWEKASKVHMSSRQEPEEFDKSYPINEI